MAKKEKKKKEKFLNPITISLLTILNAFLIYGAYLFLKDGFELFFDKTTLPASMFIIGIILVIIVAVIWLDEKIHFFLKDYTSIFFLILYIIAFSLTNKIFRVIIFLLLLLFQIYININFNKPKQSLKNLIIENGKEIIKKLKEKKKKILIWILICALIYFLIFNRLKLLEELTSNYLKIVITIIIISIILYLNKLKKETKQKEKTKNKEKIYAYQTLIILFILFIGSLFLYSISVQNNKLNLGMNNCSNTSQPIDQFQIECKSTNLGIKGIIAGTKTICEIKNDKDESFKIDRSHFNIQTLTETPKKIEPENINNNKLTIMVPENTVRVDMNATGIYNNKTICLSTGYPKLIYNFEDYKTNKRFFFSGLGALLAFIITVIFKLYDINKKK